MHKIRKFIQKFGLDIHKYRYEVEKLDYLKTFGLNTVIDVGANTGQFAKEIREKLPEAMIYSFEPLKECFSTLEENMKNDSKFRAYNLALGDKNEKMEINKSSYTLSSSLLPMAEAHKTAFPHTKDSVKEEVEVKRMNDIFKNIGLGKEILIKVDTQGYEDRVIAGGLEIFGEAKVLIIETSFLELYEGQPLFADIYETLINIGFVYKGALHQKLSRGNSQILFEDSLFAKN